MAEVRVGIVNVNVVVFVFGKGSSGTATCETRGRRFVMSLGDGGVVSGSGVGVLIVHG